MIFFTMVVVLGLANFSSAQDYDYFEDFDGFDKTTLKTTTSDAMTTSTELETTSTPVLTTTSSTEPTWTTTTPLPTLTTATTATPPTTLNKAVSHLMKCSTSLTNFNILNELLTRIDGKIDTLLQSERREKETKREENSTKKRIETETRTTTKTVEEVTTLKPLDKLNRFADEDVFSGDSFFSTGEAKSDKEVKFELMEWLGENYISIAVATTITIILVLMLVLGINFCCKMDTKKIKDEEKGEGGRSCLCCKNKKVETQIEEEHIYEEIGVDTAEAIQLDEENEAEKEPSCFCCIKNKKEDQRMNELRKIKAENERAEMMMTHVEEADAIQVVEG